jgi:hypothetical protein
MAMLQNYRIDDVSTHKTVHRIEVLALGVQHVIVPFFIHRALATKAIHGSLPLPVIGQFQMIKVCNERSTVDHTKA